MCYIKMMKSQPHKTALPTSIAALGIVYGDIGTSPLYAIRESLANLPINEANVLGVLSFIFWSLIVVVSFKYLLVVLNADNDGEGGVLALLALVNRFAGKRIIKVSFIIGIFSAGLMLGDGMLTPAISVLSAIEGCNVITNSLSNWILPISCLILILLFSVQSFGTSRIGFIFGPIILLWFFTIGILGLTNIINRPLVLSAINPYFAYEFLQINGWKSYILLGDIFLVVTGAEAIYADLGHLSKYSIRNSWFFVALPALLLNYFGQGAYLLDFPNAITNPFYSMSPSWFLVPLLIIATLATIIASQAVISATFSLTKQAILLGLYPYLPIVQTSESKHGQIYIPEMNFILAVGTLFLVLTFKTSSALAHAYGIAVNLVMVLTTIMIATVARKKWRYGIVRTILLFTGLLVIELGFLGANFQKFSTGGWMPILLAAVCAFIMYTWHEGMEYLRNSFYASRDKISKILQQLHYDTLYRLTGLSAIFVTDRYDQSGGSFFNFLLLSLALPENILIVSYAVENIPYVKIKDRFELLLMHQKIYKLTLHYGFMDCISIPHALAVANSKGILPFKFSADKATYFVEIPNVVASPEKQTLWFYWQEKIFAFLMRNYSSNLNVEFFQLPHARTIAIGTYCVI